MKDWRKAVLTTESSIRDALSVMDDVALRSAIIVDADGRLAGMVTDGDIRRGLLNNITLNQSVDNVMTRSPITAPKSFSQKELIKLMRDHSILSVPVVNESHQIVRLATLEEELKPKPHENPVFIMAGGFGTRLRPMTDNCPKPMLHVGGRPILETIITMLASQGFKNIFISTHYLPEQITSYFKDGQNWNVNIHYIHEEEPLGTGGALSLLPETLPPGPILMINGDVLTNTNCTKLIEQHEETGASATMCVREYDIQIPFGVVTGNGDKVVEMEEKPLHRVFVNAGIYVLNQNLRQHITKNTRIDMPTFLEQRMKNNDDVRMFAIHEYWLDIGRVEDFQKAQIDIRGMI